MLYVSEFIGMHVQMGFMPFSKDQYKDFPFTNPSVTVYSPRVASLHMALGMLRVFDATQNTDNKKVYFNWFDKDNSFIMGIKKAPQYPNHFWVMFFLAAPFLGRMSKLILEAETPEEIDSLRAMKITINDYETTKEVPLISAEIRAIIDNALFLGAYGHRSRFEAVPGGVPVANRTAFYDNSIKLAEDNIDQFYASWKRYRAAHPVPKKTDAVVDDADTAALLDIFYGDEPEPDDGAAADGADGDDAADGEAGDAEAVAPGSPA